MVVRSFLAALALFAAAAASLGCNDIAVLDATKSNGDAGGGGGATTATGTGAQAEGGGGAAPDVPYPADHPSMPQIPNWGGAVLHDPVIVGVTFPNDTLESFIQGFDAAIGDTAWWSTVNGEYGVGKATYGGHVTATEDPGAHIYDSDVQAWIDAKIADGTLPSPTDQTIYALYYPSTTTISFPPSEGGGDSCSYFLGYHNSFYTAVGDETLDVVYAVINRCGDQDSVTETASHELTEASTDPHPLAGSIGYVILDDTPWTVAGGENADMCSMVSGVTEGDYSLTRSWSNANALIGDQPCVPVPEDPDNIPYFNGGIEQETLYGSAGATVSTLVDCYSFGPLPNDMTLAAYPYSPDVLGVTFDKDTCTNGDVVTMTFTIASTATHQTNYHYDLEVTIDEDTGHLWRGMVFVE